MKFPVSGIILEKSSTYPDQHGKYISAAWIELSASEYQDLKNKLNLNTSADYKDVEMKDFNTIYDINGLKLMVIAFNKDGKTILYEKRT